MLQDPKDEDHLSDIMYENFEKNDCDDEFDIFSLKEDASIISEAQSKDSKYKQRKQKHKKKKSKKNNYSSSDEYDNSKSYKKIRSNSLSFLAAEALNLVLIEELPQDSPNAADDHPVPLPIISDDKFWAEFQEWRRNNPEAYEDWLQNRNNTPNDDQQVPEDNSDDNPPSSKDGFSDEESSELYCIIMMIKYNSK